MVIAAVTSHHHLGVAKSSNQVLHLLDVQVLPLAK